MTADIAPELHSVDPEDAAATRPAPALRIATDDELEIRRQARRHRLRNRHAEGVARLMSRREDLRGVHPLADLVADSVNWSA